ncbi:hypothetical protein K402DRAFT_401265 [Aulographum hederae CBS 113979]|uniref:MAPEG family protein n=1 Tax=Aulographum hederae CBS 113979 TaxID=1176131 RepID=A0A6G1HBM6_9PEZI|nr:hypothetical protein K402DRAFT_401265 [Aulographum hederae CBS 113979]
MATLQTTPGNPLPLLRPALTLISWTFIMEAWMYATRIPAVNKYKPPIRPAMTKEEMNAVLPPQVRWKADNYNHLHEQPTIFYAVIGALAIAEVVKGGAVAGGVLKELDLGLAWGYVGIRVVHSLVHAMANPIMMRFGIFASSSFVLLGLTGRALAAVF